MANVMRVVFNHQNDPSKIAMANAFGKACNPDTYWDTHDYGEDQWRKLALDGVTVTAWGQRPIISDSFAQIVDEHNAGGYAQGLLDLGLTEAQIDFVRTFMTVDYTAGTVEQGVADYYSMIDSMGYTQVTE